MELRRAAADETVAVRGILDAAMLQFEDAALEEETTLVAAVEGRLLELQHRGVENPADGDRLVGGGTTEFHESYRRTQAIRVFRHPECRISRDCYI